MKEKMLPILRSNALSNVIAMISLVVAIWALFNVKQLSAVVENHDGSQAISYQGDATSTLNQTINNGANIEDIDYEIKKNTERMYRVEGILEMVEKDPNLHFSLTWKGSPEEYKKVKHTLPEGTTVLLLP